MTTWGNRRGRCDARAATALVMTTLPAMDNQDAMRRRIGDQWADVRQPDISR